MIKAIIFDYYGVLTTDSYLTWLDRHAQVTAEHASEIEQLSKAQDEGIDDAEFFSRLAAIADEPAERIQAEFNIHGVAHRGLINYIRHLRRKGLETAILSNADISLYNQITGHGWNKLFEVILCSGEAGVTKPDPKIFRMVLSRLDVLPAEALFVDDREYNVQGALAAGIEGIHYTGLTNFKAELIARGIDR